jgi:hypothetical protein
MAKSDAYARTYNSFSGIDIKAIFGNRVIGELQAISYSVTREKAGIWTMGSPDPRAYNRGKRGLAGSMIFVVFDRSSLLEAMKDTFFLSDKDEARTFDTYNTISTTMRLSQLDLMTEPQAATLNPTFNDGSADFDQEVRNPFYVDQIPPFDVSLVGANEYGALALKKIIGVELLNEGSGYSIDDIVAEEQFTFVARHITPWIPQKRIEINPSNLSVG